MPGCMLIERAEKYNVHDINSVNLLSIRAVRDNRCTILQFLCVHYERSQSVQTAKFSDTSLLSTLDARFLSATHTF